VFTCSEWIMELNEERAISKSGAERETRNSQMYYFFIMKGLRIKHIDLPTDLDLIASTKYEIERI